MKTIYSLLTAALVLISMGQLSAQVVTDVITNVNQPTSLLVTGGELFYGNWTGGLSKVDLANTSNPTVIYPSSGIYRTTLVGNDLYLTANGSGMIVKLDITENDPEPVTIVSGLTSPAGIAMNGNMLYFSDQIEGTVSKIDLSQLSPTVTVLASGLNVPTGIALVGNELYIAEFWNNRISKIDVSFTNPTIEEVVANISNPTEVFASGNQLFVSLVGSNKVITIDLNESPPAVEDLVTNINHPTGLFFDGTDLYISVFEENKIVKYSSADLGLEDLASQVQVNAFPNPTSDFIQFSGLEYPSAYIIYDLVGHELQRGVLYPQERLDVQHLNSGVYSLNLIGRKTITFVKN